VALIERLRARFRPYGVIGGPKGEKRHNVQLKFCPTCLIYRPPRTVHCGLCNACIENLDHHCPWIGTCVGKRNYHLFFRFIFFVGLLAILTLVGSITRLTQLTGDGTFKEALKSAPLAIPLICFTALALVFLGVLLFYQVGISLRAKTTNEDLKQTFDYYLASPYDSISMLTNFYSRLFPRHSYYPLFKPRSPHESKTVTAPSPGKTEASKQEIK